MPAPDPALGDSARHGPYVTALFDAIQPSYDRFTRWFSFGMDARWKRRVRALVRERAPGARRVIDLATGTGDLLDGAAIVGVDRSLGMLRAARRAHGPRPLVAGDMLALPLCDGAAEVITACYAFRNVLDAARALAEARRALRPGGLLVTLDFYLPPNRAWRWAFLRYLTLAGGAAGWLLHRDPRTYGYIAPSLARWRSADEFATLLARSGFTPLARRTFLGGGLAVHASRSTGPR